MATDLRTPLAYLGNDSDFRAWVDSFHAQLTAVGMVQTADTGQLATPCVASRPSTSSYAGYEIWRFPDSAEQTACPIFLKIEYGIGTAADRPAIRIQAATSTNGAGTLNGQVQSAAVVSAASASKTASATLPSYVSAGNGWLHIASNIDGAAVGHNVSIFVERPMNGDGTLASSGFRIMVKNSGNNLTHAVIPASGTVPSNSTDSVFASSDGQNTAQGVDFSLWPGLYSVAGRSYFTQLLCYKHSDIAELGSFTTTHLNASRTYMPMGDSCVRSTEGSLGVEATAILWQ